MGARLPKNLNNTGLSQKSCDESIAGDEINFRHLFDKLKRVVIYFDASGRVKRANSAASSILGIPPDQISVQGLFPSIATYAEQERWPMHGWKFAAMLSLALGLCAFLSVCMLGAGLFVSYKTENEAKRNEGIVK